MRRHTVVVRDAYAGSAWYYQVPGTAEEAAEEGLRLAALDGLLAAGVTVYPDHVEGSAYGAVPELRRVS